VTPTPLLVGAGAAVGAPLRYAVARWVDSDRLPVATLAVNVAGSFLLGLLTAAGLGPDVMLALGTGFCGSLTTYSSFAAETTGLWTQDERLPATGYALGTLAACLTATTLGVALGSLCG
jgi:CrcB protein